MEEQFKLVPMLSLSEMALRRVAINLWQDPDTSANVEKYGKIGNTNALYRVIWARSNEGITKKVPKLVLPETLKERLEQVVIPINAEIRRWHSFHQFVLRDVPSDILKVFVLEALRWTCTGAIDPRKTAEELLRLELFSVEKRFRLACLYCLEDCIPTLWANLPEEYKSRLDLLPRPPPKNVVHLEYYWASVMRGEAFNLSKFLPAEFVNESSTYLSLFRYSAHESCKAATEYFFQKLTDEERGGAAFRTLCDVLERDERKVIAYEEDEEEDVCVKAKPEVFHYMLSIITREQRMQVFKKYPFCTLQYLLRWPFLDLLLEVMDIIWKFLPERRYKMVLNILFYDLVDSHQGSFSTGYYFPDLFLKIFIRSPVFFKEYFVYVECWEDKFKIFHAFTNARDAEGAKVIWRNLNSVCKDRLLCNFGFFQFLSHLLNTGRWQLVEFFFINIGKAKREELRSNYKTFARRYSYDDKKEKYWEQFFESLDKTGASSLAAKFSQGETPRKRKLDSELEIRPHAKLQCVRTSWGWDFGPFSTLEICFW